MNIKQAKEYIENTVRLYLKKDEFGEYQAVGAWPSVYRPQGIPGYGI